MAIGPPSHGLNRARLDSPPASVPWPRHTVRHRMLGPQFPPDIEHFGHSQRGPGCKSGKKIHHHDATVSTTNGRTSSGTFLGWSATASQECEKMTGASETRSASTMVSGETWDKSTSMPRRFISRTISSPNALNPSLFGSSVAESASRCVGMSQRHVTRENQTGDAGSQWNFQSSAHPRHRSTTRFSLQNVIAQCHRSCGQAKDIRITLDHRVNQLDLFNSIQSRPFCRVRRNVDTPELSSIAFP